MIDTPQKDDFDKLIELKKLEIEKLRLEQASGSKKESKNEKYEDVIWKNVSILGIIAISFFLPWGSLEGSVSSGSYNASTSFNTTGFQLGLFSFTWLFVVVCIPSFIFAILNKVSALAITAIFGVFLSIWTLSVLDKMGFSISFAGATTNSSFRVSVFAFIPLVGFILLLLNFFVKSKDNISMHDEVLHTEAIKIIKHNAYIKQQEYVKNKAFELKEKNKIHYQNDKKLKIILILTIATELILTTIAYIFYKYCSFVIQLSSLILFLLSCYILFFFNRALIVTNHAKLITKIILEGFFFIFMIYSLLRNSFNSHFSSTGELLLLSLIFIGIAITIYLGFISISCITLNKKIEENEHF